MQKRPTLVLGRLYHRPLKEMKLPHVLREEDVTALLKSVDNLKHRAMLWLIYAAGLRRSELINLRVNDIDSKLDGDRDQGCEGEEGPYQHIVGKDSELIAALFQAVRT